jgi:hypothetical protein
MSKKASRSRNAAVNIAILLLVVAAVGLLASGILRGCSPPVNPVRVADNDVLVGKVIQLEVLNGCGQDGLASEMQSFLRARGFDVVASGNHATFGIEKTFILDRIGDDHAALEVAKALGLNNGVVSTESDPGLYVDASVIIGCDYESIPPFSMN